MKTKNERIKILLVDDDEMMRIYFRDIFWIHGRSDTYDVDMASSLDEAMSKVLNKETKPDTIFLDIMLPIKGINDSSDNQIKRSLEFIKKIKDNKEISPTKIIIYSSQKEEIVKKEVEKMGADGYIIKGELMPKEIIDFTDKIHGSNN